MEIRFISPLAEGFEVGDKHGNIRVADEICAIKVVGDGVVSRVVDKNILSWAPVSSNGAKTHQLIVASPTQFNRPRPVGYHQSLGTHPPKR